MATSLNNLGVTFPDSTTQTSAGLTIGAGGVVYENGQIISANYTMSSGKSGMSVGPITINAGVSIILPADSRWVVL